MDRNNTVGALGLTLSAVFHSFGKLFVSKTKQKTQKDLQNKLSDVLDRIKHISTPNISSYFYFQAFKLSQQLDVSLDDIASSMREQVFNRPISTCLAEDIAINVAKLHANTSPYKFQDLVNEDNTLNLGFISNEISEILNDVVPQWQSKLAHQVNEEPQFNILREKLIDMMLAIHFHTSEFTNNSLEKIVQSQIHLDSSVLDLLHLCYMTKHYFLGISHLSGYAERWLGDIAYSSNQNVKIPKKLSELLALPALRTTIGDLNALLFHIILGPPPGLNIRNLVWHGFIHEEEVPGAIIPFVLMLMISTAKQLPSDFKYQQRTLDLAIPSEISPNFLHKSGISRIFNANSSLEEYQQLLLWSTFVFPGHKDIWNQAFKLYNKENYFFFLLAAFPLLEQSVRRIWVAVNNIEAHYLCAETHTIMTTMEDILAERVDYWYHGLPAGNYRDAELNKLPEELGRHITLLLMDLFTAKRSPKIRDLIAHGAINDQIDVRWAAHRVFAASTELMARYSPIDYGKIISKSTAFIRSYRSKFHPFAKVLDELRNTYKTCLELLDRHPAAKYRLFIHDKVAQTVNDWISRIKNQLPNKIVGCLFEDFDENDWKIENYWRDYEYKIYYANEEETVIENLCSISEALSSFVNAVLSSYLQLNAKVYRRTAWKQQRNLFKKLQDEGVPMTILIAQVYGLIIEDQLIQLCAFTSGGTSAIRSSEFFENCTKTMGILNTSATAGHFGKLKPILLALHGVIHESQSGLSRREMSLLMNALHL